MVVRRVLVWPGHQLVDGEVVDQRGLAEAQAGPHVLPDTQRAVQVYRHLLRRSGSLETSSFAILLKPSFGQRHYQEYRGARGDRRDDLREGG